ncbi:acetyltransferase (GNAT) family protein [Herbihabitans rhizosphaerae]|uniref:Acetyltransferase (GNAT) family protein n=1 Tax=Herbihabitans rhizosphaerae TaxID=1872711 RepID=A0A4Q7KGE0_9PSEU|nr:GNAT family N-acetyltransferase [Herbihabitans rhizosphaerae]RZS34323.1 acetyltransferase (GNAT) family protein [Herbihabitans rhizosphaerae]
MIGELTHRLAARADLPVLEPLIESAISTLLQGFLTPEQIAASRAGMGLDTRLIDDGTYFIIELGDTVVGCGGWSRRSTLYGGDHSAGRDDSLLDPATDPARVRAMYTRPGFTRRGIGRLVLSLAATAAAAEGFSRLELVATKAGRPLYQAAGFEPVEEFVDVVGGVEVPLVRMGKAIPPSG